MTVDLAIRSFFLTFLLVGTAGSAAASDFIDTRITFTIADDNVLQGPQESPVGSPSSPNFLPNKNNTLFFDNYEKRDTGFENLSYLALYAHQPGFFAGVDTEAALIARVQFMSDTANVDIREGGSYIKIAKTFDDDLELSATAFPVSADRFRLGYSYDLSWGGSTMLGKSTLTPGIRLQLSNERFYSFVGYKAGLAPQRQADGTFEKDTVYGVLGGAGVDILDELRLEAGGGFFHRGIIDKPELQIQKGNRLETAPWQAFGGSAQATYHVGIPIGVPIDFRLYKNDPLKREEFFRPEVYNEQLSWLIQAEVSSLGQTLQDPERPASTVVQAAVAADFAARFKWEKLRAHILFVYRDMTFILFDVPSLFPFVDLPDGITASPEYFVSIGADWYFETPHLTVGLIGGAQRPAHVTAPINAGNNPPASANVQTVVVREANDLTALDPGTPVELIYALKGTFKWDVSKAVAGIGEVKYTYDPNLVEFAQDPQGIPVRRVGRHPHIFGFNVMLQARF